MKNERITFIQPILTKNNTHNNRVQKGDIEKECRNYQGEQEHQYAVPADMRAKGNLHMNDQI